MFHHGRHDEGKNHGKNGCWVYRGVRNVAVAVDSAMAVIDTTHPYHTQIQPNPSVSARQGRDREESSPRRRTGRKPVSSTQSDATWMYISEEFGCVDVEHIYIYIYTHNTCVLQYIWPTPTQSETTASIQIVRSLPIIAGYIQVVIEPLDQTTLAIGNRHSAISHNASQPIQNSTRWTGAPMSQKRHATFQSMTQKTPLKEQIFEMAQESCVQVSR
jgi:hypothetical protein